MAEISAKQLRASQRARTSESYRSGLGHPLWWAALVVLVLNDHVLKHAGILPGSITGKLSDFAGLIVAPVLVCAIVRAQSSFARVLSFAGVVLPFVALELFPSAAELTVRLLSYVGIPWKLWSDPTDLFALVVLPLAWKLSWGASLRPSLERAGALLGAGACLATSIPFERIETRAYLVNLTHEQLEVHVYRVADPLDCSLAAQDPKATITSQLFEWESCRRMDPIGIVPLDQDWSVHEPTEVSPKNPNTGAAPRTCDAAIVRISGAPDTVVFWNGLSKVDVSLESGGVNLRSDEPELARAIFIESLGPELHYGVDGPFIVWELPAPSPPTGAECGDVL
jgi:hypothetical protein